MNKFLDRVGRFAKNPYLQMFVALVLVFSSIAESWESMGEDLRNGKLRIFHGTLLLGLTQVLRTLPDVVEGAERATEAAEARRKAIEKRSSEQTHDKT